MIIPETPSNCTGIFTRERKIQPGTLHNAVKAQKAKKRFFCSDNTSTARKGKDATLLTGCDRYPAGCGLPARCKSKRRQAGRGEPPPPPPSSPGFRGLEQGFPPSALPPHQLRRHNRRPGEAPARGRAHPPPPRDGPSARPATPAPGPTRGSGRGARPEGSQGPDEQLIALLRRDQGLSFPLRRHGGVKPAGTRPPARLPLPPRLRLRGGGATRTCKFACGRQTEVRGWWLVGPGRSRGRPSPGCCGPWGVGGGAGRKGLTPSVPRRRGRGPGKRPPCCRLLRRRPRSCRPPAPGGSASRPSVGSGFTGLSSIGFSFGDRGIEREADRANRGMRCYPAWLLCASY